MPLGGNRGSKPRTLANLLIVMLLGGLWHGAAYTYIVWGGIHGVCLAVERGVGLHRPDARRSLVARVAWFAVVQAAVLVAWIVFRSDSMTSATAFLGNLVGRRLGGAGRRGCWRRPGSCCRWSPCTSGSGSTRPAASARSAPSAKAVLAAAMAYAIATMYASTSDFIYFQF